MTGLDHKLAVITFETRPKAKKKTQKLSLLLRNPAVLLGFSIKAFAAFKQRKLAFIETLSLHLHLR